MFRKLPTSLYSLQPCNYFVDSTGEIPLKYPFKRFLTSWPWPLTSDLQTWHRYSSTWSTCQNSSPYVYPFGSESGNRQTDRHTHGQCQNYYTRHVTDVGCKEVKYECIYDTCLKELCPSSCPVVDDCEVTGPRNTSLQGSRKYTVSLHMSRQTCFFSFNNCDFADCDLGNVWNFFLLSNVYEAMGWIWTWLM